ncbi:MAG: threonine/serine exporter family protein [Actinomycetaceae bacterium]|nr:threonine/serine exporter family protein [Actinomycetaceae bacterium]
MANSSELHHLSDKDPHGRLAIQSSAVTRFGRLVMSAGAGAYRTKASMSRVAAAVGIERQHSEIFMQDVITTSYANGTFRTSMAEHRGIGVNVDRLELLNRIVAKLKPNTLAEDLEEQMDEIEAKPHLYTPLILALASGIACAGFSFLNGGGPVECFAVSIGAFFGQLLRSFVLRKHMNHFGVWMLCAFVAATIYISIVALLWTLGFASHSHQAGFISSILFLIPGFPMVTAMLDFFRGDYLSGITRGTYVVMVMLSAGISVWLVAYLFDWQVAVDYTISLPYWALIVGRMLATYIAVFGFAMLFNTPLWIAALASSIPVVTNVGRLVMADNGIPAPLAVFLASLGVGLFVAAVSRVLKCSRVALSVPAVVIMIPGVPFYRSITTLNPSAQEAAINWYGTVGPLFQVAFTVLAIGIGLALARMLTDYNWAFETWEHKTPDLTDDTHAPVR